MRFFCHPLVVLMPVQWLTALVLLAGAPLECLAAGPDLEKEFETLAGASSYFEISDVLYKRAVLSSRESPVDDEKYAAFISRIRSISAGREELIPLLKHANPKVRTLAVAVLAMREDPAALPFIADLLPDDALTFSREGTISQSRGAAPIRTDVTVGENAQEALFLYLAPAGYTGYQLLGGRSEGQKSRREFDEYWSTHKGRDSFASLFAVRMTREPFIDRKSFDESRDRIRADLKKIPQPDRTWITLWLANECVGNFTHEELLATCRELGPESLMGALKRKRIPSNDPDLQRRSPGGNNHNFTKTARFILENATLLLRPQDADVLVTLSSGDDISPLWFIAAARLQSAKASAILHGAYAQFSGKNQQHERVALGVALWQLASESEGTFLTNQFYDDALINKGTLRDGWSEDFIEGISANPSGKKLIAAILQDKRLDDLTLNRGAFGSFARAVNGWAPKPVVSKEDIARAGEGEGGKGGNPEPTHLELKRELLHRMRDSVPSWNS